MHLVNRAVLISFIAALPAAAQQAAGRPMTIDDALNIRTAQIADVSPDGRWVALTIRVRRDALTVDNARFGDPTYVSPSLAEFQLIDATTGKATPILPGKTQVRNTTFTEDGKQLAFFVQGTDNAALKVLDVATMKSRTIVLKT